MKLYLYQLCMTTTDMKMFLQSVGKIAICDEWMSHQKYKKKDSKDSFSLKNAV